MEEDGLESTENDLIFIGHPSEIDSEVFLQKLNHLIEAANRNSDMIKDEIMQVCDTYQRNHQD